MKLNKLDLNKLRELGGNYYRLTPDERACLKQGLSERTTDFDECLFDTIEAFMERFNDAIKPGFDLTRLVFVEDDIIYPLDYFTEGFVIAARKEFIFKVLDSIRSRLRSA